MADRKVIELKNFVPIKEFSYTNMYDNPPREFESVEEHLAHCQFVLEYLYVGRAETKETMDALEQDKIYIKNMIFDKWGVKL